MLQGCASSLTLGVPSTVIQLAITVQCLRGGLQERGGERNRPHGSIQPHPQLTDSALLAPTRRVRLLLLLRRLLPLRPLCLLRVCVLLDGVEELHHTEALQSWRGRTPIHPNSTFSPRGKVVPFQLPLGQREDPQSALLLLESSIFPKAAKGKGKEKLWPPHEAAAGTPPSPAPSPGPTTDPPSLPPVMGLPQTCALPFLFCLFLQVLHTFGMPRKEMRAEILFPPPVCPRLTVPWSPNCARFSSPLMSAWENTASWCRNWGEARTSLSASTLLGGSRRGRRRPSAWWC